MISFVGYCYRMHAPRCSSPNWDTGRLLCVCLIQLAMVSGCVATDVFVLNSKKKVTHLLVVSRFYCQRPDSASQNSLSKSLLANKSDTPIGWLLWLRERNAVSLNAAQHPETEVKDGHFLPESGREML